MFFKSTFFKDVNFPINGGTLLSSLLQILKALGFPFVALSKILSAILFLCEYCSQAQALPPGPQSFSDKTPYKNSSLKQFDGFVLNMSGVSFVSEAELDEIREKRQKEWEKVRKEDDPLGKC